MLKGQARSTQVRALSTVRGCQYNICKLVYYIIFPGHERNLSTTIFSIALSQCILGLLGENLRLPSVVGKPTITAKGIVTRVRLFFSIVLQPHSHTYNLTSIWPNLAGSFNHTQFLKRWIEIPLLCSSPYGGKLIVWLGWKAACIAPSVCVTGKFNYMP